MNASRRWTGRLPLRLAINALVAIFCALILALDVWQTIVARESQAWQTRSGLVNLAESLSQHAESTLETTDAVVAELQFWTETRGIGVDTIAMVRALMATRLRESHQLHALVLIDANGTPIVSSVPLQNKNRSFRDRVYFRYHSTHGSRDAFIGPPVIGRGDGTPIVTVSRRLNNRDGSFRGIAVAALSTSSFDALYHRFDLGPRSLVVLLSTDGTIFVRRPFLQRLVGASVARGPVLAHLRTARSGVFTATSITDGVTRLTAYRQLDRFPLVTEVAIPVDDVFATWRTASIIGGLAVLVLVLAIVSLARFLTVEIMHRERAQHQLENFALVDSLTGIANRRHFDSRLSSEWHRAIRDKTTLGLLMIDVDHFKTYNDCHGHQLGDEALKALAACMQATLERSVDFVARYGGEEFCILLPSTTLTGCVAIAERIRQSVIDLGLAHDQPSGHLTVSIGCAVLLDAPGASPEGLLQCADEALYAAKRRGRNVVCDGSDVAS